MGTKSKLLFLIIAVSATAIGLLLYSSSHNSEIQIREAADLADSPTLKDQQSSEKSQEPSQEKVESPPEKGASPVPTKTSEVMTQALADFAYEMEKKQEQAKLSEENAATFFTQLEGCVVSRSYAAEAAQALCLRDAEELASLYPSLKDRFAVLKGKASPAVLRLVDAAKRLVD